LAGSRIGPARRSDCDDVMTHDVMTHDVMTSVGVAIGVDQAIKQKG